MDTFDERIRQLEKQVGDGRLVGTVEVDQRYAAVQHEELTFKHPRGGQAKYLEAPLVGRHRLYLRRIAERVLDTSGPVPAMRDAVEDLSDQVEQLAPLDEGDLRRSGHPSVVDNGRTAYDRPPKQRRLTDEELRAKAARRARRRSLEA